MKLVKTWIGTPLCVLALIVLAGIGASETRFTDDPKFITAESTIGKSAEEIVAKIGPPERKDSCRVPLHATKRNAPRAEGEDWAYTYSDVQNNYEFYVCLIKGVAVAEYRIIKTLRDNVSYHREDIVIDYGLAEFLSKGNK